MAEWPLRNRLAAECAGTFLVVFSGTGAMIVNEHSHGAIGHAGIALTFGLAVMTAVYAFGDVSGAHLNPAVSIGFVAAGRTRAREAVRYCLVQVVGALAASALLHALFPDAAGLGCTLPSGSAAQSFVLEAVLACMLMLVILAVARGSKEKGLMAGITVGGLIALEAMFAGPISGASMNPARSLAPAVVSAHWDALWIYLTAPVLGMCVAVPIARAVFGSHGAQDARASGGGW